MPQKKQNYYTAYTKLPPAAFSVSWDMIPEPVRVSLEPLFGIQPVTQEMCVAAKGKLFVEPSLNEVKLFKEKNAQFQMINVVLSLARWEEKEGNIVSIPYAVSITPASKREKISTQTIEAIAALKGAPASKSTEEIYTDFNPFDGTKGKYWIGADYLAFARGQVSIETCGIVIERYFLNLKYDRNDVVEFDTFLPNKKSCEAYLRNRIKTVYKPFTKPSIRRIWGIETQTELLLFQELLSYGLKPEFQYLIYPDGSAYPSLYNAYSDIEFRHGQNLVTEADFYFPEQKFAVFCDGAHHRRVKNIEKDNRITENLNALGIQSIRLPNDKIKDDVQNCVKLIREKLKS